MKSSGAPGLANRCILCCLTTGSTAMSLSRRDLLTASALLLAGPGAALRAAGKEAAAGETPMVLCWNENPYGPSPAARLAVSRAIARGCRYPADAEIQALVEALATHERVGADCIVTGTGSGELLCALGLLCGRDGGGEIAAAPPPPGPPHPSAPR